MSYEDLSKELTDLKSDLSARARAQAATLKAIDAALKALKDPAKNAVALGEAAQALKKAGQGVLGPEIYEGITGKLDQVAGRELDQAAFLFGRDLRAAFDAQGIQLKGNPPRFAAEPLIIEADMQKGKVNLKYGQETLNAKPIAMDPARVLSAYQAALKSLSGRKFNPGDLLEQMFEAYRRALIESSGKLGDRVNVVDWYRELVWLRQPAAFKRAPSKSSFSDYPRAYFAYDVLQLRRNNQFSHKGHRLQFGTATIDATGNPSRSMWMPEGADEGRYIMDVFWTKEAQ